MHGPTSIITLLVILAVLASFALSGLAVYGVILVGHFVWKWVRGHS